MSGASTHWDIVILGQGLAGTALAWSLRWVGLRVLVIDRNAPVTSSKIAAGLITPVTGQALAKAWRYDALWPAAANFYCHVERELNEQFFQRTGMVRLFASETEIKTFERRRAQSEYDGLINDGEPLVNPDWIANRHGGFEMKMAARLNVPAYLRSSREFFRSDGGYLEADIDLSSDLILEGSGVQLPRLEITASRILFCQGYDAGANPWFRDVDFKPAKGEILTVRIPGLTESRVIHQGVWLCPMGHQRFKVGATYDWDRLDFAPTGKGRGEIESKLKEFLRVPYEVVDHQAAVRPIHRNQLPVVGLHPRYSQLGYFNGLGSKGTLQAPYFASQFVSFLRGQGGIDADVDVRVRTDWQSIGPVSVWTDVSVDAVIRPLKDRRQRPLTEQAQQSVSRVLKSGDVAIDATAGNGHDCHFLADLVGPTGKVIAFDIQATAIQNTARRLRDADLSNVDLILGDHGGMKENVPIEFHGSIAAVMMNLGYLPGGDKRITTASCSTVLAIRSGLELLRTRGLMTILAYTGHEGGADEAASVERVLDQLPRSEYTVSRIDSQPGKSAAPVLFLILKCPRVC